MVFFVTGFSVAEHAQHMSERSTLTNGFWGLNEALDPVGIDFALSVHQYLSGQYKGRDQYPSTEGALVGQL